MSGRAGVTLSPTDFDRFRALVRQRAGIEIPDARKGDLEKGIAAALDATGAVSPEALYELLAEKGPRGAVAFEAMVPAITINETHFFRNRPQMQALETEILPKLIEARRDARRLRIWSAACSSGEEPYTLAMLLDRLLPAREQWDILIHGTDIDHEALAKAGEGLYGNWSFREVPADVKQSYFQRADEHRFELSPAIRSMVRFSRLNLVDDPYPSPETATDRMDLVLCRNVLIYFKEETIRRIVDRFHEALVPDGWLVVGHAEPSQEIFHRFQVKNFPGTIVYRKAAERSQIADRRSQIKPPAPKVTPMRPAKAPSRASAAPARPAPLRSAISDLRAAASGPDTAYALFLDGKSGEAINNLEELAAASPADHRAPYLLAKIFASRMRFEEAERWVDIAIANRELAPEAHYLRGLVLQEQKRLEDALEAFRRSVFLDPTFVLSHYAAAGIYGRTGQLPRAQKSLDAVAELLAGRPPEQPVPEGDGLIVGRLLELVTLQRRLVA